MSNRCPPKIAVEAYFLEGLDLLGLKDHVTTCPTCGDIGKALETERGAFLQRYPFSRFWEEIELKRGSFVRKTFQRIFAPRAFVAVLAMAGLAGLMIVTLREERPAEPQIQLKGGVGLSFYASYASGAQGKVEPGKDGMDLPAGAQLQFVYSNMESPYLYLVGVEENGAITAYFPDRGVLSGSVQTGSKIKLPQGLSWEPKSAYERFYALFSQEPVPIGEVRAAVSQLASEGKTVERATKLPLPYAQASILLNRKNGP